MTPPARGEAGLREREILLLNTYPLPPEHRAALEGISPRLRVEHRLDVEGQDAIDALAGEPFEILLADHAPSDLSAMPALRWLQFAGAGIDLASPRIAAEHGLLVTHASGTNSTPIGEYVLGALFFVSQRVAVRQELQRRRAWSWEERPTAIARTLRGHTIAIVGYGSVGREAARLAAAVGMRVLAARRRGGVRPEGDAWRIEGTGDPEGVIPERIVGMDGVGAIVAEADYVIVATPLTPATRGALGSTILAAIRPHAWLVNVSRGDVFDEGELIAALQAGRLAGATLDVQSHEPLPTDDALWDAPNLIITTHVAGFNERAWEMIGDLMVANVRRYVAGQPVLNRFDPAEGY